MNKIAPFIALILISAITAWSQTSDNADWFRIWDKAGKEGYIDANGRVVIKPKFDRVTDFSEGLAAVLIGDKWGYIDRKGEVVIKTHWKPNDRYIAATNPFKEGLAVVVEYAQWAEDGDTYFCGYIDKTGAYVIKPQLRRECRAFSEGLAWVVTDERDKDGLRVNRRELNWAGYIDKKGNWAIKPDLYQGDDFKGGVARVRKYSYPEANWYFIDKKGSKVEKAAEDKPREIAQSERALVLVMLKTRTISERPNFRNIYGYKNRDGKYVWLSPDAENHLDKDWVKANYVGTLTKK